MYHGVAVVDPLKTSAAVVPVFLSSHARLYELGEIIGVPESSARISVEYVSPADPSPYTLGLLDESRRIVVGPVTPGQRTRQNRSSAGMRTMQSTSRLLVP